MIRRLPYILGTAALIAAACAEGNVTFEDEDSDGSSGGSDGGNGTGGDAVGGSTGGGGTTSPCGIDCSSIQTPQCNDAICNVTTLMCEIVASEDGTTCDDGAFCTVGDACMMGECVAGGQQNDCGMMPGECQTITCDEASQTCNEAPSPNGAVCTPADLCIVNAHCTNGLCQGQPKDCFFAPVPNECHTAVCNPMNGQCEPQPDPNKAGDPCVDPSQLCVVDKTCDGMGNCAGGTPKDCSFLSVGCNDGVCNTMTGVCEQIPIPDGMQCAAATDDCNQGFCTMGNCVPTPTNQGMPCDDGLVCTSGTVCTNGTCSGGMSNVTIYFSEDFQSNAAGWTLDTDWEMGSATAFTNASFCGTDTGDPGTDHTATMDNGVAGVNIGGTAPGGTHPHYWLTSPPVDTSAAPTVFLEYWRWLNSDYPNFMTNKVEVFNGVTWVNVWTQPSNSTPINDPTWTPFSYNVTAHKNTQMRVRFGFDMNPGAYTCTQWNVDDVVLASGPCQ
jgi:hypothetical protein